MQNREVKEGRLETEFTNCLMDLRALVSHDARLAAELNRLSDKGDTAPDEVFTRAQTAEGDVIRVLALTSAALKEYRDRLESALSAVVPAAVRRAHMPRQQQVEMEVHFSDLTRAPIPKSMDDMPFHFPAKPPGELYLDDKRKVGIRESLWHKGHIDIEFRELKEDNHWEFAPIKAAEILSSGQKRWGDRPLYIDASKNFALGFIPIIGSYSEDWYQAITNNVKIKVTFKDGTQVTLKLTAP